MIQDLRFKIQERGQLLTESVVAISILIVGLMGIFGLLSRSLSLNNVVSSQYIASNLAAEGIEITKNLIDANIIQFRPWNQGFSAGSFEAAYDSLNLETDGNRFLLFDSINNAYNYQSGQPTFFKRVIEIDNNNPDEIKVTSKVNWQIKGGSYSVNAEDHFFNWRGSSGGGSGVSQTYVNTYNGADQGVSNGPLTFDGDFLLLWVIREGRRATLQS